MKSSRCIAMVKRELEKLGVYPTRVELGEIEFHKNLLVKKIKLIDKALKQLGFELISNKNNNLLIRTKEAISEYINLPNELSKPNFAEFISNHVNSDYNTISNIFLSYQGITIEKYIIAQKIERVKELLIFDKLSLSDIAYKLKYSSVAHLSNQFKKVTGITPTIFKQVLYTSPSMRHTAILQNNRAITSL